MAKSNYKLEWYDYIIGGVILLMQAIAITLRWYSKLLEGKSFTEINSSKTGGIT